MANGTYNLGIILTQAEQIKGLRSQNQTNLLAQQRGAQFRPLLQEALANPQDQNIRNQLIATDPQAAAQAFGAQSAGTGAQQSQFDLSEDRAGQGVRRTAVAGRQRLVQLIVGVDVNRQHRPEDLFAHQLEVRLLGQHNRGLDEVALTGAVVAAG